MGEKKGKKEKNVVELNVSKEFLVLAVAGVLFIASLFTFYASYQRPACSPAAPTSYAIAPDAAGEKLVKWINAFFKAQGVSGSAELVKAEEANGVVKVTVSLSLPSGKREETYYVSPDGSLFFPQAIDITNLPKSSLESVEKSDRPKVELFVMSYCPFGLQMEKAIIPVVKLLGDKADISIHFVPYVMHGEEEMWENLRQYCIREREGSKFWKYLECFVQEANAEACMQKAGIDASVINACMAELNKEYNIAGLLSSGARFPPFPLDEALANKYDVRGSPTLVINGTVVKVSRSPEAVKEAICSAFTTPPPECNTKLSDQVTAPGFGALEEGGASTSSGSCG